MKVVLCCADYSVDAKTNGEYRDVIGDVIYYLQIDPTAIFPLGTIVHVFDKDCGLTMQFRVIAHHYDHEINVLNLNVAIDGGEMSPQQFIEYLKKYWITGDLTDLIQM